MVSDYMAHGFCFSWEPRLVWIHVGSDILTGLAYYAIAFAMAYFIIKRRDEPFALLFLFFALFIMACGTTHFFAAYTVYAPDYWPEGYVKAFTMVVSVITAILFIPKIPLAVEMPSLAKTLKDLQTVNEKQRRTEEQLNLKVAELERFNYTLSHELRSPLVTVKSFLGFLELDLAAADSESITKDIEFMNTATDKMKRLLDELLDMSRIGRVINEPVSIQFCDMVSGVLAAVAGPIIKRGVTITVDETILTLAGDLARLEEIWQNLIENAVKYMGDQPAPLVEIGVATVKGSPIFYVHDNGMGIDPRYHEKVFGLFEKLDGKSEGTGVGLALVRRITELNGGKIWVESEGVGHGSCFKFTLPGAVKAEKVMSDE